MPLIQWTDTLNKSSIYSQKICESKKRLASEGQMLKNRNDF